MFDIAIIGGGINGAGIARDAAGRGLSALLVEKGDLAQATSSASSKLVHGGLRYLEHYEFRLVREALQERETLLSIAPHIIWPLDFVLPDAPSMRPVWMLRAGLFLYDHLAQRRSLNSSARIRLEGGILAPAFVKGFRYADCWVDDARLVVLNARDAADKGADIRTRTECVGLERSAEHWTLRLSTTAEEIHTASARVVINAAGPWTNALLSLANATTKGRIKQVKGSHLIVPRVHEGKHAYIFQLPDRRILFVLPFEEHYSLIGTTDAVFAGDAAQVSISEEETDYLLNGVNAYLARPLSRSDIVWSYSGVRALYDDSSRNLSAITRDYTLELDTQAAPLLSVFGGKITTYRRLAEHALEKLAPYVSFKKDAWTGSVPLPGGGPAYDYENQWPWLDKTLLLRWQRQYGTCMEAMIGDANSMAELGGEIAPGIYTCELEYAYSREWARRGEDFLWRRTKTGLCLDAAQRHAVIAWFEKR